MGGRISTIFSALSIIYFCSECYSQGNLALLKPSFQSTTWETRYASLGNDGNKNPSSFTHTDYAPPTFWYVDLQDRYKITSINLLRRGDCTNCHERWQDLIVGVSDDPPTTEQVPGLDFRVCHVFHDPPALTSWTTISCSSSGRYVILISLVIAPLSVAEVEVYGTHDAVSSKAVDAVFNLYQNTRDVICNVNILEEQNVSAMTHCMKKCLLHKACVAISFHKPLCRLHYLHLEHYLGNDELFETLPGGAYYQKP